MEEKLLSQMNERELAELRINNFAKHIAQRIQEKLYWQLYHSHETRVEIVRWQAIEMVNLFLGDTEKEFSFLWLNEKLCEVYQALSTPVGISHFTNPMRKVWSSVKAELESK